MTLESSGSADSRVIRYRADIDGLRAVAVLSVIAFHLWRPLLRGGYFGVDIFFVVSGFLITSIIWKEVQSGSYSIRRFYDRRLRRIMPALMLVLSASSAAAIVILLPTDLVGFARSLLATLAFAANVYFWRDTNYFARGAEDKPLLHLWSLGVEEQFYILFPLVLIFLWRAWPHRAGAVVAALTLGSLAMNVAALFLNADSTAFFLLPTRAWELGVGAMLALYTPRRAIRRGALLAMSICGAVLIAMGLALAPQPTALMPAALPAAAGAALLIFAGNNASSPVGRILSLRPVRFVGLISYSLYLWHWPIIVFVQYYLVRQMTPVECALAIAAMFCAATASWHFVERPFRGSPMPIARVRVIAVAGAAVLAMTGVWLLASAGLPRRLSAEAALINEAVGTNYRCPVSDYVVVGSSRACLMNLPSRNPADADAILLGNSHAQMYAPLWASILAERGRHGLLVPANGCLPILRVNITRECIDTARRNAAEVIRLRNVRTVIVAFDWAHPASGLVDEGGRTVDNADDAALVEGLDDLVAELERAGKSVILIGPIAEPGWDVASIMSRELAFGHPFDRPTSQPTADFLRQFNAAIAHYESRRDIRFVRPDRVQCPQDRCLYLVGGRPLFADNGHLAQPQLGVFRGEFVAALEAERVN